MKPLIVSREAELDIADSFAWYYERNPILRFPHSVLYRELTESVVVIACFHGSQDPKIWKTRL